MAINNIMISTILTYFAFTQPSGATMPLLNANDSYQVIECKNIVLNKPTMLFDVSFNNPGGVNGVYFPTLIEEDAPFFMRYNCVGTANNYSFSDEYTSTTDDKEYELTEAYITGFRVRVSYDLIDFVMNNNIDTLNINVDENQNLIFQETISITSFFQQELTIEYYFDDDYRFTMYQSGEWWYTPHLNDENGIGQFAPILFIQDLSSYPGYFYIEWIGDVYYKTSIDNVGEINQQLINNYKLGYDKGLDDGSPTINEFGITDIMQPITTTFDSFINFFDINLFGNFKLGYLFFIPLIFTALMFILKAVVK